MSRVLEKFETTNIRPYHLHHIVTKKYFKSAEIRDKDIIHNIINLIPLCSLCHKIIHSKKSENVEELLNIIFNSYPIERKNEFEEYLKNNTNFNNFENLKKYYLV